MDDATKHAWKEFMAGPGGKDLMQRLLGNEAKYQAEGIKSKDIYEKGMSMAKIEAIYTLRSGIQDIIANKSKLA